MFLIIRKERHTEKIGYYFLHSISVAGIGTTRLHKIQHISSYIFTLEHNVQLKFLVRIMVSH